VNPHPRLRHAAYSHLFSLVRALIVTVGLATSSAHAAAASVSLGSFTHESDVGLVSQPSKATYDPVTEAITLRASGANIWGTEDAFGYVWKEASGDIAIAADVAFVSASKQGHRKAGLMFRQTLDSKSPYADVMLHGDGHASLQFRSEAGGPTRTIQCPVIAPKRVRLEKRGDYVTLSLAGTDGVFSPSGCVVRLPFSGTFLAGLAVCAHDNTAVETATFSSVAIGAPPAAPKTRTTALEIVTVASFDRRVVFRAEGKMDAPHFSPDGSALYFNRDGRVQRVVSSGTEPPTKIDTGFAIRCINDHGLSPDGTQLVISDLTETGKSRMYLLPIGGGRPTRVDVPEPALWHGWSPDGQTLTYCAERGGDYDVFTVPVLGGVEKRLTTAKGNDNGPDYSADGKTIYFHSIRSGRFQIWRMNADGTNQEQVTDDEYFNWFPHPSPDGKWIAILSSKVVPETGHPPDGEYILRLIPTAGGPLQEVARFRAGNGSFNVPCWSRDSTRIAYASYDATP
jgi:TolB protein